MRNFQGITFTGIRIYKEIFKSALVYLESIFSLLGISESLPFCMIRYRCKQCFQSFCFSQLIPIQKSSIWLAPVLESLFNKIANSNPDVTCRAICTLFRAGYNFSQLYVFCVFFHVTKKQTSLWIATTFLIDCHLKLKPGPHCTKISIVLLETYFNSYSVQVDLVEERAKRKEEVTSLTFPLSSL